MKSIFTLGVLFCLALAQTPKITMEEAKTQIQALMKHYDQLLLAMDSKRIAALYLPEGQIVDSGKVVVQGPAAIQSFLASFEGKVKVQAQTTTTESITLEGNTAHVKGVSRQTALVLDGNKTVKVENRLEAIWVRQASGQWLLQRMGTVR